MANMGYIRMENTYRDLVDVREHLFDEDLSSSEKAYALKIIELSKEIIQEAEDNEYFDSENGE